jgi:hypothetical protein
VTKTSKKQDTNPLTATFGKGDGQDGTINEGIRKITEAGRDEQRARDRVSKREEIRHLKRVHEYMRRRRRDRDEHRLGAEAQQQHPGVVVLRCGVVVGNGATRTSGGRS